MQVGDNKVVSIHYTLKNENGEVLDSSENREPLSYIHGQGNIIPGLENALTGAESQAEIDVTVTPEEGYGERHEQLIQDVPMSAFEGVDEVKPGMQFQAQTEAGPRVITVQEVGEEEVKIDGNHPLAGETLHFKVKVDEVRDASDEEIEHGHVHGEGEGED
jgi:FKBP-type peptidyl-prolyl cis-trans isomerase SlyD